jgi:hypothetical protein
MANPIGVGLGAATLAALIGAAVGAQAAPAAKEPAQSYSLKAGEEVTLPITVEGQRVVLGTPRASKLGTAQPRDGEITVGLTPRDKGTFYEHVLVTEKTPVPIDFVATGFVGEIKIDERILCGRLDQPTSVHIGSTSWRVSLNSFEVGKGGSCE